MRSTLRNKPAAALDPTILAYLFFVHFQLNNAAVSFRSGEGLLSFTALLHSYVNGESRLLKGCFSHFGRKIGGEFSPGLLARSGKGSLLEYLMFGLLL